MAAVSQAHFLTPYEGEQPYRRPLTRARTASDFPTLSSITAPQRMATAEVHGLLDTISRPRGIGSQLHPSAGHSMTTLRPVSRDARSTSEPTQLPLERSENLARSLLSKSSLFLRRKNSKAALTSFHAIEWDEVQDNRTGSKYVQEPTKRRSSKHGRLTPISYGMQGMLPQSSSNMALTHSIETMLKKSISEPYDFQHLTHTSESHAKALQTATKKSHNELVTEFSAMRASQSARKELNGIKAESIAGGRTLSRQNSFSRDTSIVAVHRRAPSTPAHESELNLSPKSRDATRVSSVRPKGLRISQSVDNFSRINPRSFSSPSPPHSPPPRRSSRHAFNMPLDAIGKSLSPSKSNPIIVKEGILITRHDISRRASVENYTSLLDQHDPSSVGNAVSTPDNSACILRPQLSSSSIALADVPEEEEMNEATRQSMQGLGLMMASAHRGRKTSTSGDMDSDALPKPGGEPELASPSPEAANAESRPSSNASVTSTTRSSTATQTDTTMTTSFSDNWEDDIDYCYEHAAEADCAFDWDRMSRDEERRASASDQIIDEIIDSAASGFHQAENEASYMSSVTGSQLNLLQSTDPQPYVYTYLDPSHIKASSQTRSPLSSNASTIFASEALTPSEAASSPNVMRFSRRYERESGIFPTSPSLLTLQDYERRIAEDSSYSTKGPCEGCEAMDSVTDLPLYEPRFPLNSLSGEESSCSSANPLSKCNSRESLRNFMRTRSHESLHGNTSSIGSLPELVHSGYTSSRESFATREISTKFSKASLRVDTADLPSTAASMPEDVSPLTATPGPEQSLASQVQSALRDRSLSDSSRIVVEPGKLSSGFNSGSATPSTANKSFAGRMRSASTATTASGMTKKSRASYSLFPAVPASGPR